MSIVKTAPLEKSKVKPLIDSFFRQFETCCNRQTAPTQSEFENILADNFQISSNNKLVGKNRQEYLERIKKFQKNYSQVKISAPLEEPIISENKVVVRYDAELVTREQQKNMLVNIMAIATIDNNLLTSWSQIAHVMGRDEWDS